MSKELPLGTGLPVVINMGKPVSKTVANSEAQVSPLQLEKAPKQSIQIKLTFLISYSIGLQMLSFTENTNG